MLTWLIIFIGVIGGLIYGYSYLKAKSENTSVATALIDTINRLIGGLIGR